MRIAVLVALACMGLAGCATVRPPGPGATAVATTDAMEAAQREREAALGLASGECAAAAWQMTGRVALSNGRDGGSGRIDWTQAGGIATVNLSAPVTRQSWTLRNRVGAVTLEGVANGPLQGVDAQVLLREATGWEIPVDALGCWLRGARAAATQGAARIAYEAAGLPVRIEQAGWTIDYVEWGSDGGVPVPTYLNAERDGNRVRLRIDRWGTE